MLGTIFYAIGCFAAAAVLSSLVVMMRPMTKRDDLKPWKTFIFMFILCLAAPFGYCEVLTKAYGKPMEPAIAHAYENSGINGAMRYFRITSFHKDTAKALVVGSDKQDWGGQDSPVISVTLSKKEDGTWKAESFKVLSSGRLNQDSFIFPPYY